METIILNGTTYDLRATTGTVLSTNKNLETKVSGSGGGGFSNRGTGFNNPVRVTSTTTVHDQIFLEDSTGKEHSYQLSGFNLACREGNKLTVLTAAKQGQKGYYFAVINHATDNTYYNKGSLDKICGPNKVLVFGLVAVVTVLGFLIFGGGGLAVLIIAVIAALIYYNVTLNSSIKTLKAAINPSEY